MTNLYYIENLNKNSTHSCMPTIAVYRIDDSFIRQATDDDSNELMTGIVNLARENGITDLFVLDKKFVLDALKEKLEREGLR